MKYLCRKAALILCILTLAGAQLFAGSVSVLLSATGPVENDTLEQIILQSATLSLEHKNINVLMASEGHSYLDDGNRIAAEAIASAVGNQPADFALVSCYELEKDTIRIEFAWYDSEQGAVIGRETTSGKIGLSLDRIIDKAIGNMLDSTTDRIGEVRQKSPETDTTVIREFPKNPSGSTGGRQVVPFAGIGAAATPGVSTYSPTTPQISEAVAIADVRSRKAVEVAAGFAAFIAIGDSTDYLTLGYNPTFDFNFRINTASGFWGIGLNSGINTFEAEGLSLAARSMVIPVGLDVRYVFESAGIFGLTLRLSGGPAFFMLQPPDTLASVLSWDVLTKVIPYANAGLGLRIKLAHFMGIALDVGYSVYLEDYDSLFFIMGLTPAATVFFSM